MKLALIWAQSENGVIGRDGRLPWRIPREMAHFRKVTLGKPVIMGRSTFESLPAPLSQRTNIVLTRRDEFAPEGVTVVHSLADALAIAEAAATDNGAKEAVVIGGAEVYAEALPLADRLYVTIVHAELEGDTFAPEFDEDQWALQESECVASDDVEHPAFTMKRFERV